MAALIGRRSFLLASTAAAASATITLVPGSAGAAPFSAFRRLPLERRADLRLTRRELELRPGRRMVFRRYTPASFSGARMRTLLVPDLMFGAQAYDLRGRGLAWHLASRGHDVWVPESWVEVEAGLGRMAREGLAEVRLDLLAAWNLASERLGSVRGAVVAQGITGGLLASVVEESPRPPSRVVLLSPLVEPYVTSPAFGALLEEGGRFDTLAYSPAGRATFELLFARGGRFRRGAQNAFLRTGLRSLGPVLSKELLDWARSGELALPGGTTLKRKLADYARPTYVLLPLLDRLTPPESASAIRELAPRAKITLRALSRGELLREDYTHLSLLHGRWAEQEIYPLVSRRLEDAA